VGRTPFGLNHRFISGTLQQCMPEFEADFAIFVARPQDFGIDQRL
jgi:hypothetical protein